MLQPESWVKEKKLKKHLSTKFYAHILVHIILMFIISMDINLIGPILLIGGLHYIIDLCKLSVQNPKYHRISFIIDQLFHVASIVFVVNYFSPFIPTNLWTSEFNHILPITLSLILLTNVSSNTIRILISKWSPQTEDSDEDSLKDAGSYIGILERLFVFGFVISGNVQAVGFLLAAKSVFRFGDLKDSKDRKLTEYILIGTLISFGIAILIALLHLELRKVLGNF